MSKEIRHKIFNLIEGLGASGSNWTTQYQAVYDAMITKPSASDKAKQQKLMYRLIKAGVFAKAEIIDVFGTHSADSSLINWKNPGTFNPTVQNTPTFTQYQGYKMEEWALHNSWNWIKTNFIPLTDGTLIGKDDISVLYAINEDAVIADARSGCIALVSADEIFFQTSIKQTSDGSGSSTLNNKGQSGNDGSSTTTLSSIKHISFRRDLDDKFSTFVNYGKRRRVADLIASTSLPNVQLYVGCLNHYLYGDSYHDTRPYMYYMLCSALTDLETRNTIKAFEEYYDSLGTGLIAPNLYNLGLHGHSFMATDANVSTLADMIAQNSNCVKNTNPRLNSSVLSQFITEAPANLDIEINPVYKNILVICMGVNDIVNTAGQGATAYALQKTYVQDRLAAGWNKVLVYTMTPATVSERGATFESERNIFNELLRNDLALINGVVLLDTDTITELQYPCNVTYFGDMLHYSALGAALARDMALSAIASLI
jgi:hypothetical protein